ncbi:MAG: flagellar basal body-associated FliL family protein [Gammaproteobacteria bacterium]
MRALRLTILSLLAMLPALLNASAPKEEEANPLGFEYVPLAPNLVVSFGEEARMGFLRVEVSIRVASAAAEALKHHMPAIRHELIMLFSRQNADSLAAPKREELRLAALEAVRKLLEEAGKVPPEEIQDLMFPSFMIQR